MILVWYIIYFLEILSIYYSTETLFTIWIIEKGKLNSCERQLNLKHQDHLYVYSVDSSPRLDLTWCIEEVIF